MGASIKIVCKDCGKAGAAELDPNDANDWGWIILDEIKRIGFELSEIATYCKECAAKYERGPFNCIKD